MIYKGNEYALLQRDDVNGLIEDDDGHTEVVKVKDLKPGFKKHTPGHRDSFFDVSGDNSIYAGQWIFMPARGKYQEEYQTKFELAVYARFSRTIVFRFTARWTGRRFTSRTRTSCR